MRQLEECNQLAIRAAREKAIALSKQTAQRQKAMEERKKAAIEAEEQRRRKALEERRRAQLEARQRFKLVVSKLQTGPRKHRSKEADAIANKAVKESSSTQKNSLSTVAAERVALGSQVEVRGSRHRVSSLDDILRSVSSRDPDQSNGSNINITDYDDGGVTEPLQTLVSTDRMAHAKSASDSNLTSHTHHGAPVGLRSSTTPLREFSPVQEEKTSLNEGEKPVTFCASDPTQSYLQPSELCVLSPDPVEDDECSSPDDSFSASVALQDSLDLTSKLQTASKGQPLHPRIEAPPTTVEAPPTTAVLSTSENTTKPPDFSTPVIDLKCSYYNSVPSFVIDTAEEEGSDSSSVISVCAPTVKIPSVSGHSATEPPRSTNDNSQQAAPPHPPKLIGILKKPVSKLQLAVPAEQSVRRSSASVKKVRFSDQGVCSTLSNSNQPFAVPGHSSKGFLNTRMLNGTSPLPPSYMYAPKIRLLLNQMPGLNKASNEDASTTHVTSNVEAEPSKKEPSSELHIVNRGALDNARTELIKAPNLQVPIIKGFSEESKTLDGQTVKNTCTAEPPQIPGSMPADNSPTDEDINRVWTQIRSYVQDRYRTGSATLTEQSLRQRVGEVVQVAGGGVDQRTAASSQTREADLHHRVCVAPKQLTQRPSNRPLRVETISGHDWKVQGFSKVPASHGDLQFSISGGAPLLGANNTLSFEEQKVMQSLEKLNHRLVDRNPATFPTMVVNPNARLVPPELEGLYITQNSRTRSQGTQKIKTGKSTYPEYSNVAGIRHK